MQTVEVERSRAGQADGGEGHDSSPSTTRGTAGLASPSSYFAGERSQPIGRGALGDEGGSARPSDRTEDEGTADERLAKERESPGHVQDPTGGTTSPKSTGDRARTRGS